MLVDWKSDLKASLVVFLVALPLCLGIALASNAPMSAGIISGIVGGVIIGFASGSNISVSGPAAGLTVIVASGISQVGGFEIFGMAVFLAGVFQILFGLLRGGAIGDYFPSAVIKGMLAAIGIILIIKQFPNAIGLSADKSSVHYGIIIVSVFSFGIMIAWEKMAKRGFAFFKLVPGPLFAVIASVLINEVLGDQKIGPQFLVSLPSQGGFQEIFKGVSFPNFSLLKELVVIKVALTISIVASLETLLCVDAADKIDPFKRKTSKNRELLAQGLGNSFSGLLGGLPLTAVIVRTTTNISAGGKTKLSAILHGLWLLFCVALIPQILNLIPLATLACVLLMVGYKLTKPEFFFEMKKRGFDQLIIFCATIVAIVFTDLLVGIFIGFGVALFFELKSPPLSCVIEEHEGNKVKIKFIRNVSFLHKARLHKLLQDIPVTKEVFVEGTNLFRVHVDVREILLEYKAEGLKRDQVVVIST